MVRSMYSLWIENGDSLLWDDWSIKIEYEGYSNLDAFMETGMACIHTLVVL